MSWASRRRFLYLLGIVVFLVAVIGIPIAYKVATIQPTCHDGKQDQGETAPDRGGPCLLLDERYLEPWAILWERAFRVRDGSYNAVAYIQNPNKNAGVVSADYTFSLYDSDNILIAERTGKTYIMPGGVTPVFVSNVSAGNRIVAHTTFVITDNSLAWERMSNPTAPISVSQMQVTNADTEPQLSAIAANTSVSDLANVNFVGVVFDTQGNAINASATNLQKMPAESSQQIGFTWPDPFTEAVGTIDIIPLLPPIPDPKAER